MKNKYQFRSRISERLFRDILRLFCSDICALTAAELAGVNKNTTHQLYGKFRDSLRAIIKCQVLTNSTVYTDGWRFYDSLVLDGYRHHRIHHHENEFARGKNHVNGIESFWSFAKLRMAKMRGLRKAHFLGHLLESEWRCNLSS